jgi:hypothetical protein
MLPLQRSNRLSQAICPDPLNALLRQRHAEVAQRRTDDRARTFPITCGEVARRCKAQLRDLLNSEGNKYIAVDVRRVPAPVWLVPLPEHGAYIFFEVRR